MAVRSAAYSPSLMSPAATVAVFPASWRVRLVELGQRWTGPSTRRWLRGAVPIHQMPPLHMTPVRGPSTRTPVPDINDEDTVTDVPQPLPCPPPPPESPPTIPPCPLGLYRQMQLREMRRHGVLYSWQLPQP
ncbi:hypothetical protein MRX96_028621 [Rhipicephalus microplus]